MKAQDFFNEKKGREDKDDYSLYAIPFVCREKVWEAMEEYATQQKREEAMRYLNWVKENQYWKSTDTRFPETLGRWVDAINGNVPFKDSLSDIELYVLFKIQNP